MNCSKKEVHAIDMTKRLFSEFGLDSILDTDEWVKIRKRAKMDSRRIFHYISDVSSYPLPPDFYANTTNRVL